MARYVNLAENFVCETVLIPKSKFGTSGLEQPFDSAQTIIKGNCCLRLGPLLQISIFMAK